MWAVAESAEPGVELPVSPPPPWPARVRATLWWHRPTAAARSLGPSPSVPLTVGMVVDYLDSPVGPYREVLASPVLPLITDSFENLDGVCAAAQAAGAASFSAEPVFLKPCAQQVFLPFLESRFPHLLRRYRERFERSAYLNGHYPEMLQQRVKEIVSRRQMKPRDAEYQPEEWTGEPQMELFAS